MHTHRFKLLQRICAFLFPFVRSFDSWRRVHEPGDGGVCLPLNEFGSHLRPARRPTSSTVHEWRSTSGRRDRRVFPRVCRASARLGVAVPGTGNAWSVAVRPFRASFSPSLAEDVGPARGDPFEEGGSRGISLGSGAACCGPSMIGGYFSPGMRAISPSIESISFERRISIDPSDRWSGASIPRTPRLCVAKPYAYPGRVRSGWVLPGGFRGEIFHPTVVSKRRRFGGNLGRIWGVRTCGTFTPVGPRGTLEGESHHVIGHPEAWGAKPGTGREGGLYRNRHVVPTNEGWETLDSAPARPFFDPSAETPVGGSLEGNRYT